MLDSLPPQQNMPTQEQVLDHLFHAPSIAVYSFHQLPEIVYTNIYKSYIRAESPLRIVLTALDLRHSNYQVGFIQDGGRQDI